MDALPESLNRLIDGLSDFPGIGKKTAERMAFYLLKSNDDWAQNLAKAIMDVKEQIHECPICHNISDTSPCSICSDAKRDPSLLCVVEDTTDLVVFEKTNHFRGKYHVLGGVLSPLDGIGPEDLHFDTLLERINGEEEVIIATNPSAEGETTALYLAKLLKEHNIKVTRLASGIPVGGDLEYTDEATLVSALEGRRKI
ncbi:MAG: recombination mediator RecR [Candidatus Marinimicrobia bacterium]|jgi:recombination protein RecR|nr:recombination mediator RecR [Candidatus Neomarinimicrobiota bacterium]MDP6578212.1 recombination mediator RecR [Candidatus Neomarinimicrobiota bacterium]MDP7060804.1 recombination mediator RecR [Candidatus Neomarinimicrobiota bacterium]|tara:strand:- start:7940 stop:8533 length:594 start_codon:yes stop_codon:yes gene_type:complete